MSVTFGSGVTSIGPHLFGSCGWFTPKLESVYFRGNRPDASPYLFDETSIDVLVYYLPGTTGWDWLFCDRFTLMWDPIIQAPEAGFGTPVEGFGFNITGGFDFTVVVEASTNLTNWIPVQTCTLSDYSYSFHDSESTNYPARFYRLRSP